MTERFLVPLLLLLVLVLSAVAAFQAPRRLYLVQKNNCAGTFATPPVAWSSRLGVKTEQSDEQKTQRQEEEEEEEEEDPPVDEELSELMEATEKEPNYLENPNYLEGTKPAGAPQLATENLIRQGTTIVLQLVDYIRSEFLTPEGQIPVSQQEKRRVLPSCLGLRLSNESVKEAERVREAKQGGRIDANIVSRGLYDFGCLMLDGLFEDRPIERFWFLETIARIPYFSYTSMLHLYESLGWWRGPELRKVHHAEEWNELHHLLIMESLGGNSVWSDRFLGYHAAIVYYWLLNVVFLFSPGVAYQFMELLESHAVDTYSTFVKENEVRLKQLPAPVVAKNYYTSADLYLFDDFQVSRTPGSRRPPCNNLYDVFNNIAIDEGEHVKTMIACQDYAKVGALVVSPHTTAVEQGKIITWSDEEQKRKKWLEWAETFQALDLDARADDSGDFDD